MLTKVSMTEKETENLGFVARAREGESVNPLIDKLPPELANEITEGTDMQNAFLELFADASFYKAAKVLVELLDSGDDEIRVRAASKLVDLRKDVYKSQKQTKLVKPVMDKLFEDGF